MAVIFTAGTLLAGIGCGSGTGGRATAERSHPDPTSVEKFEIVADVAGLTAGESELFVVASDGSAMRTLTRTLALHESNAAWSPDGRTIAFEGRRGHPERAGLYLANAEGGRRRLLVSGSIDDPAWSPDGRRIAFAMRVGDGKHAIHVREADGTIKRLTEFVGAIAPTWSPDGQRIAYQLGDWNDAAGKVLRPSIHVMRADGSGAGRLGFGGGPDWSPTGEKILFSDCVDCDAPAWQTFVMSADGTARQKLTSETGRFVSNSGAVWSPDGARIVFLTNRGEWPAEIWVMNADGSDPRPIPGDPELPYAGYELDVRQAPRS